MEATITGRNNQDSDSVAQSDNYYLFIIIIIKNVKIRVTLS